MAKNRLLEQRTQGKHCINDLQQVLETKLVNQDSKKCLKTWDKIDDARYHENSYCKEQVVGTTHLKQTQYNGRVFVVAFVTTVAMLF